MQSIVNKHGVLSKQPLLDSLPVACLLVDDQGTIYYYNIQAAQAFKTAHSDFNNVQSLSSDFAALAIIESAQKSLNSSTESFKTMLCLDQCIQKKNVNLTIMLYPYNTDFYLLFLSDINDYSHYEHYQCDNLKKNFRELKHFARLSAMREISSLLADQLNQPLTAILSFTQAMQRLYKNEHDTEQLLDVMQRVVKNAEQAAQIIRNIRGQINANTLNCQSHCINDLIQQTLSLTELNSSESIINLVCHYETDNLSLCVDALQIKQVILSLLTNAIEAFSRAKTPAPEIHLSTHANDGQYEIQIADNGPGIANEVQQKLFQPFVTTKENGIGTGLSVCHHIIELHNGRISIGAWQEVDNNPEGTMVKIQLPYAVIPE